MTALDRASIAKANTDAKAMHPDARKPDVGLMIFGILLAVLGWVRWRGCEAVRR